MTRTKTFALLAACLCSPVSLFSQETDFDLNSQRSEVQNVWKVPGKKIDHKGLIINPTPHALSLASSEMPLDITSGFALKDKQGRFTSDLNFLSLQKKGVKLTIDFGKKQALKANVKEVSGAYALQITSKGITITGYDERGAFYGIQTLRQIMESPVASKGTLPCLAISDYPDLPYRGVVEGFYGTPWSHEVRMSLIDIYGKYKMNAYLYGPKDDPYHSCPNWRLPYPEKEAQNIKELIAACNRNRVDFVWAIHPGQDIKWNEEDYQNLLNKCTWMYNLGVRSFAVFFDDISGEGTNPVKQTELLNRLTKDFVEAKGDISSLTVCPTDYSKLWANPTPQGSLAIYGETLNPAIEVFWTGDVVCSDLTKETMDWVNSRIKRPAYYWWNFPVTDYARHILMQGPVYGLSTQLSNKDLCGIVSNPMEHGEASKLALYGVADYSWNIAAYNPIDNWERALVEMMPQAHEAYRTFAIHSCDTETGYRRDESWETQTFRLNNWSDELADKLWKEYDRVENVPNEIEKGCTNTALLKELRPWLSEFGKLGTRGKNAIEIARIYRSGADNSAFWNKYIQNMMTADEQKAYEAHKSGTMKLQPFYENMMDDMAYGFLQKLTGETPMDYKGIGSFKTAATTQVKLMLDGNDQSYYTSGTAQKAGDWLGVDLGCLRDVREVSILQGRNSVDDVDFFDHAILECSEDGKQWKPLIDDMQNQYVIEWKGKPVKARYVRLRRLDSKRTNWAAIRSFDVNPARVDNLGFKLEADSVQQALSAFDQRLSTSYHNHGTLIFEVPQGTHSYTWLFGKLPSNGNVTLRQLKTDGSVLSETDVHSSFLQLELAKDAAKIELTGDVEIFEIIKQ
ncbi:MAG: beta-N-acetylglucosaminidase domain-containing protein [Bacteroides sp.]|nr:beta-N-acetylglucosaminidase domain-containing protein [Bacteroides sp.]